MARSAVALESGLGPPAAIYDQTGTFFTVGTVTIESAQPIDLMVARVTGDALWLVIESPAPRMVPLVVHNLWPQATVYLYEGGLHRKRPLVSDASGTVTFLAALRAGRNVSFLQATDSTLFIHQPDGGDCGAVGVWDQGTCTLTQDVNDTIQIDSSNVTVDGAGHTIASTAFVVLLVTPASGGSISNIMIKNCVIELPGYQVLNVLAGATDVTIAANTFTGGSRGWAIVWILAANGVTAGGTDAPMPANVFETGGVLIEAGGDNVIANIFSPARLASLSGGRIGSHAGAIGLCRVLPCCRTGCLRTWVRAGSLAAPWV
ncbi:MAG: hypothetical protein V2A79_04415 [Planctomycetota bacterium]